MSSYYEKFPGGKVVCIDEEIPFEIPAGWEWCRLGAIGSWGSGATPSKGHPEYYGGQIPWLTTGELNESYVYDTRVKITEKALACCSLRNCAKGDLLIAMYGATIGKVAIAGCELTTNQACCACTPFYDGNMYLFYFLMSNKLNFTKMGEGGAQPNISKEKIVATLCPLPPIEEQNRIVRAIEEVLPKVEQYGKQQVQLESLNNSLLPLLRKSILQEAIQGKLVPQDSSDESAEKLLEKINAEKLRLVKEGKLKAKDAASSIIYKGDDNKYYEKTGKDVVDITEEIPFEIPENWEWSRLKNIVFFNPKNVASDETVAAFMPMNYINPGYGSGYKYDEVKWGKIKKGFSHFAKGDIAFAKITPCFQNRKSFIANNLPSNIGAGTTELIVLRPYGNTLCREYVLFFLQSSYFVEEAKFKGTAGQQRIMAGYSENKLFPIPPYEEQIRISKKINELLASIMSR